MAVAPKLENTRGLRGAESLVLVPSVSRTVSIYRPYVAHVGSRAVERDVEVIAQRRRYRCVVAMRKCRAIHPLTPSSRPAHMCITPCILRLTLGISVQRAYKVIRARGDPLPLRSAASSRELARAQERNLAYPRDVLSRGGEQ